MSIFEEIDGLLEATKWKQQGVSLPSSLERLRELVYKKGHYFTFTQLDKVGINPMSQYDTPIGLYAYQNNERFQEDFEMTAEERRGIPFAADAPNVSVLKCTVTPGNGLVIIGDGADKGFTQGDLERALPDLKRLLTEHLESLGNQNAERDAALTIQKAMENSKVKHTPFGKFWNATRVAAMVLSENKTRNIINSYGERLQKSSASVKWNTLLRRYGVLVVQDEGYGLIHEAEPYQTVFLQAGTWQVVESMTNPLPSHKGLSSSSQVSSNMDNINEKMKKIISHRPLNEQIASNLEKMGLGMAACLVDILSFNGRFREDAIFEYKGLTNGMVDLIYNLMPGKEKGWSSFIFTDGVSISSRERRSNPNVPSFVIGLKVSSQIMKMCDVVLSRTLHAYSKGMSYSSNVSLDGVRNVLSGLKPEWSMHPCFPQCVVGVDRGAVSAALRYNKAGGMEKELEQISIDNIDCNTLLLNSRLSLAITPIAASSPIKLLHVKNINAEVLVIPSFEVNYKSVNVKIDSIIANKLFVDPGKGFDGSAKDAIKIAQEALGCSISYKTVSILV